MNNLLYGLLGLMLSTQAFSGYVAEFHFGDDSFVRPITKSIKISEPVKKVKIMINQRLNVTDLR